MRRLAPSPGADRAGAALGPYRRGAVMGMTMAEVFVLIAFILLLLLGLWRVQAARELREAQFLQGAFADLPPKTLDALRGLAAADLPPEALEAMAELAAAGQIGAALRLAESGALQHAEVLADPAVIAAAARLAESGQLGAADALAAQGVDLAGPSFGPDTAARWRFIDSDELRRMLDGAARLPPDLQADLADLVEVPDLAALEAFLAATRRAEGGEPAPDQTPEAIILEIGARFAAADEAQRALVGELDDRLGRAVRSVGGTIEPDGSIILPDAVLFEQGSAGVTPRMREFLAGFCGPWLDELAAAPTPVAWARIEGHASREWRAGSDPDEAWRNNLALSQARSQAVMNACLDEVRDPALRDWAHAHLAAVGYSSARPVLGPGGGEDPVRSRRVVFSVGLDDATLLREVEDTLAGVAPGGR